MIIISDNNFSLKFIVPKNLTAWTYLCIQKTLCEILFFQLDSGKKIIGKSFVVDTFKSSGRYFKNQEKKKVNFKFRQVMNYIKLR